MTWCISNIYANNRRTCNTPILLTISLSVLFSGRKNASRWKNIFLFRRRYTLASILRKVSRKTVHFVKPVASLANPGHRMRCQQASGAEGGGRTAPMGLFGAIVPIQVAGDYRCFTAFSGRSCSRRIASIISKEVSVWWWAIFHAPPSR